MKKVVNYFLGGEFIVKKDRVEYKTQEDTSLGGVWKPEKDEEKITMNCKLETYSKKLKPKYMNMISNGGSISDYVLIELFTKEDGPIKLTYAKNYHTLVFYLAPMINED